MENLTAKVSCFARAYHDRNNTAYIFADTAAGLMLGEDYDRIAQSMTQGIGFFLPGFKGAPEEGLRLIVDRQLSPSVLGSLQWYTGHKEFEAAGDRRRPGLTFHKLMFYKAYDIR